ncbi:MAG: MATE family efflux transporter, partial [Sphaerochaetaceae bacterium]
MTSEARIELRRKIWVVSLPIITEFFINAAISSADVVMTTFIGQTALSSLSLAAQYSSIILMFFSGINSGVTVLCSQYWGKRDLEKIDKVQGIAYRYSVSVGSVMTLLCLLIPRQLMMVYTSDPALIDAGAEYLRITAVCFLLWSLSSVYLAALRSIQRAVLSTIAEAAALFLNVTLNAVFIFG